MSVENFVYIPGQDVGARKLEDGTVQEVHGYTALGEDSAEVVKYVVLPEDMGSHKVDIVYRLKQTCPIEDCGQEHDAAILDWADPETGKMMVLIECPNYGFLWCML